MDIKTTNKTFRFKISNSDLYNEIVEFSRTNKYSNNEVLKQQYENWCNQDSILCMIQNEENMLRRNGYDLTNNNIHNKIYKSIKYYHIKNMLNESSFQSNETNNKNVTNNPKIRFSSELIHLVKQYMEDCYESDEFKPSLCFNTFCDKHNEQINNEKLNYDDEITEKEFNQKLKKMFKNQYFMKYKK
tara:strand:+ start:11 stop:571 length:561 start_codon:yes stop_codon:yes gene_type:complete